MANPNFASSVSTRQFLGRVAGVWAETSDNPSPSSGCVEGIKEEDEAPANPSHFAPVKWQSGGQAGGQAVTVSVLVWGEMAAALAGCQSGREAVLEFGQTLALFI